MTAGRKTKYQKQFAEQAAKLCALGATDADLADFFLVSERTINNWKEKHPEFLQSIKEAKLLADQEVERALFERATGYSHAEDKVFNHEGEPFVVETTKNYPPDTVAAIFWLKNRQPDKWRDKSEQAHGLSADLVALIRRLDGLSDAELEDLEQSLESEP